MEMTSHFAKAILKQSEVNIPKPVADSGKIDDILQIVFVAAGAVSVIVIILAGITLITSKGDPKNTAKARDTIIYAAIGLAICVAAFSIVSFVIGRL